MKDYLLVTGVPPGLLKQQRADASQAWKKGFGRQSANQPWQVTHVRPNTPTVFLYDEDGEVTGVDTTASSWIIAGDFDVPTTVTDIATVLADYLGVPMPPLRNNIDVFTMTHEEVLQMLHDDPEHWGEVAA